MATGFVYRRSLARKLTLRLFLAGTRALKDTSFPSASNETLRLTFARLRKVTLFIDTTLT